MIVVDPQGAWVRSTSQYPLQDPESGTRFEPATTYKAKVTEWLKGQPAIVKVQDPLLLEEVTAPVAPVAPVAPAASVATVALQSKDKAEKTVNSK
jgi:hypothetical protein